MGYFASPAIPGDDFARSTVEAEQHDTFSVTRRRTCAAGGGRSSRFFRRGRPSSSNIPNPTKGRRRGDGQNNADAVRWGRRSLHGHEKYRTHADKDHDQERDDRHANRLPDQKLIFWDLSHILTLLYTRD
jgi:hypothetical protein